MGQLSDPIARWDTRFETGAKTAVLQPFSPIVIASDESEQIRYVGLIFLCNYAI